MCHPILKPTINNIIGLWFGEDTPLRRYKVRMNPELWSACERIGHHWFPRISSLTARGYRKADLVRFARAVQLVMEQADLQPTT